MLLTKTRRINFFLWEVFEQINLTETCRETAILYFTNELLQKWPC